MKIKNINCGIILILFFINILTLTSRTAYKVLDKYLIFIFFIFDSFLFLINYNGKIKKIYIFVLLITALGLMIISVTISLGGIGSFLGIANFIMLVYLSKIDLLNKNNIKIIYFLIIILYILSAYISVDVWNKYLFNLNVINPNTIAIVLLYTTIMICTSIENSNLKHKSLLIIFLSYFSCQCIMNCHCRNALIALIIFLTIAFLSGIKKSISAHINIFLWIIIIIGIIFPVLYSRRFFAEINFLNQISDKSIYSGRDIIWNQMILALKEKKYGYLIGLGSHNMTRLGIISNYHTWYFGIIYMYGIPIFSFYFYYLINRIGCLKNHLIRIGFLSIFFTGICETSAIWINMQFLIFILLLLDNNNINKSNGKLTNDNESI